jgi:hypothetical protein
VKNVERYRISLRSLRLGAPFFVLAAILVMSFQNCDGGFHYDPNSGELNSLGGGVGDESFRLTTRNSFNVVVPEGQSLEGGLEYKIEATGTSLTGATLMWAMPSNTGNCVLKSGTSPGVRFVQCDRAGSVRVQVTAILADGSTSILTTERTTAALIVDLCGTSNSTRTNFRIAPGTGANPWNTAASPVVVFVGQTLRVCNDDTVNHQLTTGGAGCANQGAPMANGQIYDCVIANRNNLNSTTGNYNGFFDTIAGTNAAFYVRPFDGGALYADVTKTTSGTQSCATCHGGLAASLKRGSSFNSIKNAIIANSGNMGTLYNGVITDDEIRAIAFSLR